MTTKRQFNKPPLTIQEQIALLQTRGVNISNEKLAGHYLQFIGYYRLSGYANYFKIKEEDNYRNGTTFEAILEHYIFDKKLRILLFNAIEHIEIALKNTITSVIAEKYGAFWFTKNDLFVSTVDGKCINSGEIILEAIRKSTIEQKSKDTFLKHYYQTYESPELPPSWITMETLPMGLVSKILSLLVVEERKTIAKFFKTKERHLVSWMRSLTYTRNLCAHHSRIWNRVSTVKVEADKSYASCREKQFKQGKIYSQAVIIEILLAVIVPDNHWEQDIQELFSSFTHSYAQDMGFPKEWKCFNK